MLLLKCHQLRAIFLASGHWVRLLTRMTRASISMFWWKWTMFWSSNNWGLIKSFKLSTWDFSAQSCSYVQLGPILTKLKRFLWCCQCWILLLSALQATLNYASAAVQCTSWNSFNILMSNTHILDALRIASKDGRKFKNIMYLCQISNNFRNAHKFAQCIFTSLTTLKSKLARSNHLTKVNQLQVRHSFSTPT